MFRARCERCHGRQHLREVPRTAEEWSWIVRRVSWISPFAFRADQQEQVDRYVRAELASPEPQPGSAEADRVDDLVEAVLAVPTDEEAFRRAFPHDILRETER